jgi:hypothetical protein
VEASPAPGCDPVDVHQSAGQRRSYPAYDHSKPIKEERVRVRIAVVAAVAALVTAGAAMAFTSATPPKLNGSVGPGFTISLKDAKGKKVKTLKAGKYMFVITDKGNIHTYDLKQLKGGKFHKEITSASFTGKKTVTIKLTKGKWEYYCATHPTQMFGFFTVN